MPHETGVDAGLAELLPEDVGRLARVGAEDDAEELPSFVGAAPSDHPRYVILVGAEAAGEHAFGGSVAAPTFSRIMTRALAR